MNLIEKAKQLQAWAHWKGIEVNRERHKFNEEWLESQMDFIYSIRTLALAVVEAESVMRYAIGPTRDVKTRHFKDWLSRYAGEEKKR